jgi:hypothetical protein
LKQGDVLSPLLFNFALEYAIRRDQVKQDGSKLNGTQQLLTYAYDVNISVGSVYTTKKNTEDLLVCSKKIGLEVNSDKTKYMAMVRDQNTGRSHNIKIDNSLLERVEEFKYLRKNLTCQNFIQEDIKSRLNSGNGCCNSAQNLLSSGLLSQSF